MDLTVLRRADARGARRRRWAVGAILAAAVATAAVIVVPMRGRAGSAAWVTAAPTRHGPQTGAVPFGQATSCAVPYSPRAVARRTDFAFDGTVTGVGTHPVDAFGDTPVRLRVNEWFRGGPAPAVVLAMPLPPSPGHGLEEHVPPVTVATRLLVSGKTPTPGASLDDAFGWSCGFTRYYDPQTAAAWRSAMSSTL